MTFVRQLHQKLDNLQEKGFSREEVEQLFDEVLESVNKSNHDLYSQIKFSSSEYTKKGELVKDLMFEEIYTETRLSQIQGECSL